MQVLGIDVGGSGIKGAPVDIEAGVLLTERHRLPTPRPSTPKAVAKTVARICKEYNWEGPVGCGFPSVIQGGKAYTAANINPAWVGANAEKIFSKATGLSVRLINDADAAGLAEVRFGAGKNVRGVIILLTIGTGIGSAIFVDGKLVPNAEFGHLQMKGMDAEQWASDKIRKDESLSWKVWGGRFNKYLLEMEKLFWPDLFILGGGTSKKFDKFHKFLKTRTKVVPARMGNEAGIIGAALAAE